MYLIITIPEPPVSDSLAPPPPVFVVPPALGEAPPPVPPVPDSPAPPPAKYLKGPLGPGVPTLGDGLIAVPAPFPPFLGPAYGPPATVAPPPPAPPVVQVLPPGKP